ncbi:MAG: hypothetical protein L0177_07675 [Chloroflexi bacterium]|nr:hypothetical protein [Chloroflexota bacterium]
MPRLTLDLQNPDHLKLVGGEWRFAPGYVPGEANEGLVAQSAGSPARLPDYDDSKWETILDIEKGRSRGLTFGWYRITVTLPEAVNGRPIRGTRCVFETNIDDYGEVWVNGECDRQRGTVQGFNIPQRVNVTANPQPGDKYTIALLAVNGPLGAPGGGIFVRYAYMAFE